MKVPMLKKTFIVFAILAVSSVASAGKEYYVASTGSDSFNGTKMKPWSTIQHAGLFVLAGDTIHVAPGLYRGAIRTSNSGKPDARIRFVSDRKWAAVITAETPSGAIWENKGDYVDIEGFEITGNARTGIDNKGSHVRIVGNHVHNIPAADCSNLGGSGINNSNYKASDNDILGNVVNNIGLVDSPKPCYRVHGIYHANSGGHISNNITYRNWGYGIHLWHYPKNVVVANNLVYANRAGGIIIGNEPRENFVVDNIIVANNIVVWNDGVSIKEQNRTGINNRYINNLVYGNRKGDKLVLQNGNRDEGTVFADPQFENFKPDGSGDYRLKPGSPALGRGKSGFAPPNDLERRKRAANPSIGPLDKP